MVCAEALAGSYQIRSRVMRAAGLTISLILVLSLAGQLFGQSLKTRSTLKDSLTGGGLINFSTGEITRASEAAGVETLSAKDELHSGDHVRVGKGGRAEVLLNPGYYLRLSEDTEVELLDLSPDNLKVKLLRGAAILEISINHTGLIFGSDGDRVNKLFYEPVMVSTARDEYAVTQGGVYRFDVRPNGDSELRVLKGVAVINSKLVQDDRKASIEGGRVTVTRLNASPEDAFDTWSRERASLLIEVNKSLKDTDWYRRMSKDRQSDFDISVEERSGRVRSEFTVSAVGGLVSSVDEGVSYRRGDGPWEKLLDGDSLESGDRVRTVENSRAAILLYPDCDLHLSGAAEIVYRNDADKGVLIDMLKGSAIIVYRSGGKDGALVALTAPGIRYELTRPGVYRLNVLPEGGSELLVYLGRVVTGGGEIREGKKGLRTKAGFSILPFNRKVAADSFEVWSYRTTISSAASGGNWWLTLYKKNRVKFGGMWVFDKASGQHTYVPGLWSFRSPYGGQYSTRLKAKDITKRSSR
jgi:hypothetical protein